MINKQKRREKLIKIKTIPKKIMKLFKKQETTLEEVMKEINKITQQHKELKQQNNNNNEKKTTTHNHKLKNTIKKLSNNNKQITRHNTIGDKTTIYYR